MSSTASAPASGVSKVAHRRFVWNVVTAILAGSAVYAWAAYYSDSLPEITAVLGGGGLLVWATTAFSLLRKERQEEFWDWLESAVLSRRGVTALLLVGFLGLGVAANFLGSVQVESATEEGEHSVSIYPLGDQPSNPLRLDPKQPVRKVIWIWTSWVGPKQVVVKVAGYPKKVVNVAPLRRVQVSVPAALRSPVLLFRPSQTLADVAKDTGMRLHLTDEHGKALAEAPLNGESILTGGEDDINLPPELEEKWRAEAPKRPDLYDRWATPSAPREFALHLAEKQILHA